MLLRIDDNILNASLKFVTVECTLNLFVGYNFTKHNHQQISTLVLYHCQGHFDYCIKSKSYDLNFLFYCEEKGVYSLSSIIHMSASFGAPSFYVNSFIHHSDFFLLCFLYIHKLNVFNVYNNKNT